MRRWLILALTLIATQVQAFTLLWDANPPGEGVLFYLIRERATNGRFFVIALSTEPSWTPGWRIRDAQHTFVVTAWSASGESEYSNQVIVTTPEQRRR